MEIVVQTGASGQIEWGAWPPKPPTPSGGLLASVLASARKPSASILFYWSDPCGCIMELVGAKS